VSFNVPSLTRTVKLCVAPAFSASIAASRGTKVYSPVSLATYSVPKCERRATS
jgi:hypothetical protein